MHPSQRIYCSKSEKLKGRRIVVGITGSIAATEDAKLNLHQPHPGYRGLDRGRETPRYLTNEYRSRA